MGWDGEDHGNPFIDRGGIDADLWRNVGTLAQLDARVAEVWSALEQAAELTATPAFER